MTLNPRISKSGVAERGLPSSGIFITRSQRLVRREKPFTVCGASSTTSPKVFQKERSCCSTTAIERTGTLISLTGTYREGVPAGGSGNAEKCLVVKRADKKSFCASAAAKQTSNREISTRGTTPWALGGRAFMRAVVQLSSNPVGNGMKAENREEDGGRRTGVA
jgi:hypothetical protein